jgi:hypothetical protein
MAESESAILVRVHVGGKKVGYLPSYLAKRLPPLSSDERCAAEAALRSEMIGEALAGGGRRAQLSREGTNSR